ncbi:LysR family transcriptional regulator [Vibrio sp. YIC-376]|uniref:LysR family transcriptional regulator n=1 Tax=Vibrio sp. YIC-376 TaxID=3136162 RepID=UPI00402A8DE8
MDLASRLDLLLEVSKQGSFAQAADARGIDRSVLSKQIRKLEDSLGLRLLNRSTRSLSLTPAGEVIVKQAQQVRDALDKTRQLADTFGDTPRGNLRISSTSLFGRKYLKDCIVAFLKKYPEVSVEIVLNDRKVDLIGERYDLVFRVGDPVDSNLVAKKLANHQLLLLASKEFVSEYGYPETPEDLAALPAVIYSNGTYQMNKVQLTSMRDGEEHTVTITAQGRYHVNEVELLMDGAQSGLGYAIVGQLMLTKHMDEMQLIRLLPDYKISYTGGLYALYPHRNQPPLVKLFIETVENTIGNPPIWESYMT